MKITMNEKRTAVINTLKNATAPMTLAEIADTSTPLRGTKSVT